MGNRGTYRLKIEWKDRLFGDVRYSSFRDAKDPASIVQILKTDSAHALGHFGVKSVQILNKDVSVSGITSNANYCEPEATT